jgi:hypothetical protein
VRAERARLTGAQTELQHLNDDLDRLKAGVQAV